jgi:hypothetical protein
VCALPLAFRSSHGEAKPRVTICEITVLERTDRHVVWQTTALPNPPEPARATRAERLGKHAIGVEHFDDRTCARVDIVEWFLRCASRGIANHCSCHGRVPRRFPSKLSRRADPPPRMDRPGAFCARVPPSKICRTQNSTINLLFTAALVPLSMLGPVARCHGKTAGTAVRERKTVDARYGDELKPPTFAPCKHGSNLTSTMREPRRT